MSSVAVSVNLLKKSMPLSIIRRNSISAFSTHHTVSLKKKNANVVHLARYPFEQPEKIPLEIPTVPAMEPSVPEEFPGIHTPPEFEPVWPEKTIDPRPPISPVPNPGPDIPTPPLTPPPGPQIPTPPIPDIPMPPPDIVPPYPPDAIPPYPPDVFPPEVPPVFPPDVPPRGPVM